MVSFLPGQGGLGLAGESLQVRPHFPFRGDAFEGLQRFEGRQVARLQFAHLTRGVVLPSRLPAVSFPAQEKEVVFRADGGVQCGDAVLPPGDPGGGLQQLGAVDYGFLVGEKSGSALYRCVGIFFRQERLLPLVLVQPF